MTEQTNSIPSAEDFFEICLQMLSAAEILHKTAIEQAEQIRYLVAELK